MERVQNSVVIIRWHGFGFLEKSVRFLPDCCFQLLYYWLLLLLCRQVKAGGSLPWRNCIYAAVMLICIHSRNGCRNHHQIESYIIFWTWLDKWILPLLLMNPWTHSRRQWLRLSAQRGGEQSREYFSMSTPSWERRVLFNERTVKELFSCSIPRFPGHQTTGSPLRWKSLLSSFILGTVHDWSASPHHVQSVQWMIMYTVEWIVEQAVKEKLRLDNGNVFPK